MKKIRRGKYPETFGSFLEAVEYFKTEKIARNYLHYRRWKGKPICPHCQFNKVCCFKDGIRFKCKGCHRQFTGKVGTIFQNSKIGLKQWYLAIFLVISHKKGVSAYQIQRHLKVSYKTAWQMQLRIRKLLGIENSQDEPLDGVVETDESWAGGKNRNRHFNKRCKKCSGRDWRDKSPMLGMVQTGGKARVIVVPNTQGATIKPLLLKNIKRGSILVTDEYQVYSSMDGYFEHYKVFHRLGNYVSENGFTTNSIEGFWAWIKRMIMGTYHSVTRKYLQYYVNEATFRYNTRTMTDGERFVYALSVNNGYLPLKKLTGK